jgi:hypothetical protein
MARKRKEAEAVESPLAGLAEGGAMSLPAEKAHDAAAYAALSLEVLNRALAGGMKAVDAARYQELIASNCESNTGMTLGEVQRSGADGLARFMGLMETSEAELVQVEAAIAGIDDIRVSEDQKKKWVELIHRVVALQHRAREDAAVFFVYVCREQEGGSEGVFKMAPLHIKMFEVWNDPKFQHSQVEAPPGHAKSTLFMGQIAWSIGCWPHERHIFVQDTDEKAKKAVPVLRDIIRQSRYRAVFPAVRVIRRGDEEEEKDGGVKELVKSRAENSSRRFTVTGGSFMSKDATLEGWCGMARNQGAGCEKLWGDDLVPEEARNWPSVIRGVEQKWFGVWMRRLRNPSSWTNRARIIGHPWNERDLLETNRRRWQAGQLPTWRIATFPVLDDAAGIPVPIWDKFTAEHLLTERMNDPVMYALQYQLSAVSMSAQRVRWLRFYNSQANGALTTERDRLLLETLDRSSRFLSIDPASGSLGAGASEIGVVEPIITPSGFAFIADAWFIRGAGFEDWVIGRVHDAHVRGRPYEAVLIESQGGMAWGASLFVENLIRRLKEEKGMTQAQLPEFITPGVRGAGGQNKPKMLRLLNCKGYLETGMVRFAGQRCKRKNEALAADDTYVTWIPGGTVDRLRQDIVSFDGTHRSDGIDALTQWILYYRDRLKNPDLAAEVIREARSAVVVVPSAALAAFRKMLEESGPDGKAAGPIDEAKFMAALARRGTAVRNVA